jgi:chromosomal replication initiator protein
MSDYQSYVYPPLPSQPEKPLAERLAEAKKLRGTVTEAKLNHIIRAIHESARHFGDKDAGRRYSEPPLCPPEVPMSNIPTIIAIQTAVAGYFDLTVDELLSQKRARRILLPRHICMYMCKVLTKRSTTEIGRRFSGRDHTTVIHAVRKITKLVAKDKALADEIEVLSRMLLS